MKAENEDELEKIIRELANDGLDGLEAWYSTHTPEQTAMCTRMAQKCNLEVAGGSDFHGEPARGGGTVDLGRGVFGPLNIPYSVVEKLKERKARRK